MKPAPTSPTSPTSPTLDSAVLFAAIAKAVVGEQKGLGVIPPGCYPVDEQIGLHLVGTLKQAPPQEIRKQPEINWPFALALLCYRLKASRADAQRLVGEVLRTVVSCDAGGAAADLPPIKGFIDRVRDLDAEINQVRDDNRFTATRAGACTWSGEFALTRD